MKQIRSCLSVLLVLCMVLAFLPITAQAAEAHTHCHCLQSSDNDYCAGTHNASTKWTAWTSTTSLPSSAGNYYLTNDVELNYTWDAPHAVHLCLNGHVVTHTKTTGSLMKVRYTDVILTDCSPTNQPYNGGLRYGNGTKGTDGLTRGGGIYVDGGYLYIYRTDIRHNDADYGGGIYITGSGSVNLYSRASLNQNGGGFADGAGKTATYGGNIYLDYGWLKTYSCEIMNGSATSAGGGVYLKGVSAYMDHYASVGGIHANHVTGSTGYGGGVYVGNSAYLNIRDGGYIGTNSAPNGGGIYVGGHLSMIGGSVSQNSAAKEAGGIYLSVGSTFECAGGYIGSNTCSTSGGTGGVYARTSAITLSGETRIIRNTAKGSASNLNLKNDTSNRTVTIDGALSGKAEIYVTANPGVDFSKEWNAVMGSTYPGAYLHSDVSGYDVIQNPSTKELTLGIHEHSWTYTSATTYQTHDTVSEACSCGEGGSVYLTAPALASGEGSAEATLSGSLENPAVTVPAVLYEGTGSTSYASSVTSPKAPGTYRASVTIGGVTAYVDYTLDAVPATVLEWPTASDLIYGQALADSILTGGEADVEGTFAWTDSSVSPKAGTATYEVTFTPTAEGYTAVSGSVSVVTAQASVSVAAWPEASGLTYGQTLADAVLTGGEASVPGAFTWTDSSIAPPAGTADYAVTFTPDDDGYAPASGTVSVTAAQAAVTVTAWPEASGLTYGQTLADSVLTGGEASVPGEFVWADGTEAPPVGNHSFQVTFVPESGNYAKAEQEISVTVDKADPVITKWPTAAAIVYGQKVSDSDLTGGESSVPGSFTWQTGSTVPETGTAVHAVVFTPDDDDSYNAASGTASLTVFAATPEITTLPTAGEIIYGAALKDISLSGGEASTEGSFAWKNPDLIPEAGTQLLEVVFTPANANILSVTFTMAAQVRQADPAVTEWPAAAGITYGQTLADAVLEGGEAAVTGSFAWADPTAAPAAGSFNAKLVFTPEDDNYSEASTLLTVTVEKAVPVLRWEKAALTLTETGTPAVLDAPEVELVNGEVFDGDILYSFTESASTAQRTVWQNGLPKDAGIWTVRASIAESSNYTAASADLTLTILPADSGETGGDNNDGDGGNEDSIGGNAGSDDSGGTVTPGGSGTTITPNTGDYAMPLLLLGILLLSGTALPLLLRRKRPE